MPTHIPSDSKYIKLIEFLLVTNIALFSIFIIISWIVVLTFNNFPWLPGSVIPSTWYFTPINILFPLYMSIVAMLNLSFFCQFTIIFSLSLLPFMVQEFTLGRSKYRSIPLLRHPNTLPTAYRAMQILQFRIINQLFGKFLVPAQAIITVLSIFSCFVLLEKRNLINTPLIAALSCITLFVPLSWTIVLYLGGYLHSKGNAILKSWKYFKWKYEGERKIMTKFRLSCPPLAVSFGSMYVIRKGSVPVFLRGLVRGLTRISLTLK